MQEKLKFVTDMARKYTDKNILTLWKKIVKKSGQDSDYKKQLELWLRGEKSTVHLRDVIAAPFEKDREFEGYLVWDNAWISLDSISANFKEHTNSGFKKDIHYELNNGSFMKFLYMSDFDNPIFEIEDTNNKLTIVDNCVYSVNDHDEPISKVSEEFQAKILKTHNYNFHNATFEKHKRLVNIGITYLPEVMGYELIVTTEPSVDKEFTHDTKTYRGENKKQLIDDFFKTNKQIKSNRESFVPTLEEKVKAYIDTYFRGEKQRGNVDFLPTRKR